MWICPICGEFNRESVLCAKCGFDESRHYKRYRTLTEIKTERESAALGIFRKKVSAISGEEEPFDIFLSCRETDEEGNRTPDSILAENLHRQLTKEGFRVFLSGITLADMEGEACAPYLFAALDGAKVMVALGTKPEHFFAEEVSNKWRHYLSLIQNGDKKLLIPAYRDMEPGSLPEELSGLQAQDMSDLGFILELLREIRKVVVTEQWENSEGEEIPRSRKEPVEEAGSKNARAETLTAEYSKATNSSNFEYTILRDGTIEITGYNGQPSGDLVIPNTIKGIPVTRIGDRAFERYIGFSGILSLPDELATIGDRAFSGCRGLSGTLSLPDGLTVIGEYAFASCSGLSGTLLLPNELSIIGKYAFAYCSGLSGTLSFPYQLLVIGKYAFEGCRGLSGTLLLSNQFIIIEEGAFNGCDNLNVIY